VELDVEVCFWGIGVEVGVVDGAGDESEEEVVGLEDDETERPWMVPEGVLLVLPRLYKDIVYLRCCEFEDTTVKDSATRKTMEKSVRMRLATVGELRIFGGRRFGRRAKKT